MFGRGDFGSAIRIRSQKNERHSLIEMAKKITEVQSLTLAKQIQMPMTKPIDTMTARVIACMETIHARDVNSVMIQVFL